MVRIEVQEVLVDLDDPLSAAPRRRFLGFFHTQFTERPEDLAQQLLPASRRESTVAAGFAAAGKQDITVRVLMAHQAGLPAVRTPLMAGAF